MSRTGTYTLTARRRPSLPADCARPARARTGGVLTPMSLTRGGTLCHHEPPRCTELTCTTRRSSSSTPPALGDHSYLAHHGTVAVVIYPKRDTDRVLALVARGQSSTHAPTGAGTAGPHAALRPCRRRRRGARGRAREDHRPCLDPRRQQQPRLVPPLGRRAGRRHPRRAADDAGRL